MYFDAHFEISRLKKVNGNDQIKKLLIFANKVLCLLEVVFVSVKKQLMHNVGDGNRINCDVANIYGLFPLPRRSENCH